MMDAGDSGAYSIPDGLYLGGMSCEQMDTIEFGDAPERETAESVEHRLLALHERKDAEVERINARYRPLFAFLTKRYRELAKGKAGT